MLPTFVIGLREGLEAALIVGIIAAFLGKVGNKKALRQVWIGVALAVLICLGIGVTLKVVSEDLPQKQQEGLETFIGLVAVAMVSYMIIWMRRHSRELKSDLEASAAGALATGSASALVLMAFLAVLREGFETAVFLLATFDAADSTVLPVLGAVLGILVAVVIGYGIYRGGVHLNLAKFFKVTSVFLVLIAAGLLSTAAHTAHEAGIITTLGQQQAADLTAFVRPGTPLASILTGVLGLQPKMTRIEVFVYLAYAIPMLAYVLWPDRRKKGVPVTKPEGATHPLPTGS